MTTVRKSLLAIAILTLLFVIAPSAQAQVDNQDPGSGDPCFDAGSAWEDCWTQQGGGLKPPKTYTCYARASLREACRNCVDQYDDWGQPTGYKVCAFVTYGAACSCKFGTQPADCTPDGACSYFDV